MLNKEEAVSEFIYAMPAYELYTQVGVVLAYNEETKKVFVVKDRLDHKAVGTYKNIKDYTQYGEHIHMDIRSTKKVQDNILEMIKSKERGVLIIRGGHVQKLLKLMEKAEEKNKQKEHKPFEEGYCIIFSVDGTSSITSEYNADEYTIEEGKIGKFSFRNGYPCRVENIFISDKTKTVFVALTEVSEEEYEKQQKQTK